MPKPRALTAFEARKTLAHRLAPRVDRLKQFATKFGIRPYRVFLVWTSWTGAERGEGREAVAKRVEILPCPKVVDLTSQSLTAMAGGVLPMGSVRLEDISALMTQDQLTGRMYPTEHEDHIPEDVSFYYEIVEDGRGDPSPVRAKYRPAAVPFRDAGKVMWKVTLERISEDASRAGVPAGADD